MKLEHKAELIIGLIFLAVGFLLNQPAAAGLGIVATLSGLYRHIKYTDLPEHDERTKKLSGVAFGYTLLIVLFTVSILMFIDKFKILDLTVPQVLSLIFLILILSLLTWLCGISAEKVMRIEIQKR